MGLWYDVNKFIVAVSGLILIPVGELDTAAGGPGSKF